MPRPFIPFPHGAKVVLTLNLNTTTFVFLNVLHVWTPGGFAHDQLVTLVNVFESWDNSDYSEYRVPAMYLVQIAAFALDTPTSPQYFLNLGTSHPGYASGGLYGFQLTKSVALRTARRGRGQQGRIFFPPLPESLILGPSTIRNDIAAAMVDSINLLIDRLRIATPEMPLVIASYRANHAWRAEATYEEVVEGVVHNTRIDTQRRRLKQAGG